MHNTGMEIQLVCFGCSFGFRVFFLIGKEWNITMPHVQKTLNSFLYVLKEIYRQDSEVRERWQEMIIYYLNNYNSPV